MNSSIDTALDVCLKWQLDGMSAEACLSQFPQFAEQLRPLLQLAAELRRVQTPAPDAQARVTGRQRMLSTLAQRRSRTMPSVSRTSPTPQAAAPVPAAWMRRLQRVPSIALAALLVAVMAFTAAADTLPGDALYRLKVAGQQLQVALTVRPERRRQVEEHVQQQRRHDVQAAVDRGREARVEFQGLLESVSESTWIVGGLTVQLRSDTQVLGDPQPGDWVEVRAALPGDGSLAAVWLSKVPRSWQSEEELPEEGDSEDEPADATSEGHATRDPHETESRNATPDADDGEHRSTETPHGDDDDHDESEGTPTATGWAVPSATARPEETAEQPEQTPHLHETDEPDEDAEPTEVPEPGDTLAPGETPGPTETDEPENTLEPTHTRRPQQTPQPTPTLRPQQTPQPGETPEAEETEEPRETPNAEETPEPYETHEPEETPDSGDAPEPADSTEPGKTPAPIAGSHSRPGIWARASLWRQRAATLRHWLTVNVVTLVSALPRPGSGNGERGVSLLRGDAALFRAVAGSGGLHRVQMAL